MPGLKDHKGSRSFTGGPTGLINSFNTFHNSLFFRNRKTKERPP